MLTKATIHPLNPDTAHMSDTGPLWDPVMLRRSIDRSSGDGTFPRLLIALHCNRDFTRHPMHLDVPTRSQVEREGQFLEMQIKRESELNHKPPTFLGQKYYDIKHSCQRPSNTYKHRNWQAV